MKSLVESILDSDFENTINKAYEKLIKDLTGLRDDLVKFIGNWHKLDKDGDGYSTDDWQMHGNDWWDIRTHILLEFKKLIRKHHLDDSLTTWGNNTPRYLDSVKIINKNGSRLTHISMIFIDYFQSPDPDDPSYASVWIEDPNHFLEMLQNS